MAEMDEFPVVFIDPVYATVTSLSGLDDGDETADLKWIENCGMSGGIIKFSTQGCVQRRVRNDREHYNLKRKHAVLQHYNIKIILW